MNLRHVFMGVQPLGEPALVGDEHHFKPRVARHPKGLHHGGEDGELAQMFGVIAGVVVDHAIAVEKEARSQAHGANLITLISGT